MSKPLAYLILGAAGSGRREVICDLLSEFGNTEKPPVVYLSEEEQTSAHDARLGTVVRWKFPMEQPHPIQAKVEPGTETLFFLTDGRHNPVDQVESFRTWIRHNDIELGRVYCVVNCRLVAAQPDCLPWFDACIHFSDVVLLNKREGVGNKWISDFKARYEDQFLPCLFEFVKQGRIKNPAMILQPQARRISQAFEFGLDPLPFVIPDGTEFIDDEEELDKDDEDGGEPSPLTEDEVIPEDPYFLRKLGGGRHKHIPNIRLFLDTQNT